MMKEFWPSMVTKSTPSSESPLQTDYGPPHKRSFQLLFFSQHLKQGLKKSLTIKNNTCG